MTQLPSGLRERVLEAAKRTPAPTRQGARVRSMLYVALGFVIAAATFRFFGGVALGARSAGFVFVVTAGWAALAALAMWTGANRGGSMLGRATRSLVLAGLLTGPAVYAWMMGCTAAADAATGPAPWAANFGCLVATVALSFGPFLGFVLLRRASDPVHPRALGAALGAAAGACGGVLIDLHCPVTHWFHVGFAHVAPIVLFALVGALIGKRALGVR